MGFILAVGLLLGAVQSQALDIRVEENHIYLSGVVDVTSQNLFSRAFNEVNLGLALAGDQNSPIVLHLDLPDGGLALHTFNIIDDLAAAQAHGTKVMTYVENGKFCYSSCALLFLAGDERVAGENAELVFHGFNIDPDVDVDPALVDHLTARYNALLERTHSKLFEFFNEFEIIEKNEHVGFTGKTLYEYALFDGLIHRIVPEGESL